MRICPECDLEVRASDLPGAGDGAELHCPRCARPTLAPEQVRAVQQDARLGFTLREKYFLRQVIGRGGLGTVYLADNKEQSSREAAVKVVRHELAASAAERRFYLACAKAQRLDDKTAARIIGFGRSEQGYLYAAWEHLRGETLAERLSRSGSLPLDLVLRLASEIAAGLQDAHDERLVHGDLKPSNVFLVNRHRAVLMDHGHALALDTGDPLPQGAIDSLRYRAPEWARGPSTADPVDRYALGCVVYEMLTGRTPYSADGAGIPWALALREAHRIASVPRLSADVAPDGLADLVADLMHKRPDRRPTDTEVLSRLTDLQRGAIRLPSVSHRAPAPDSPPAPRSYDPGESTAPAPIGRRAAPALSFPGHPIDPNPPEPEPPFPPEPEPPDPRPGPPPDVPPEPEPELPPRPPAPQPEPELPPVDPDPEPAEVPPEPEPPEPGPGPVPDPAPLALHAAGPSVGVLAAAGAALYGLGVLTGLLF